MPFQLRMQAELIELQAANDIEAMRGSNQSSHKLKSCANNPEWDCPASPINTDVCAESPHSKLEYGAMNAMTRSRSADDEKAAKYCGGSNKSSSLFSAQNRLAVITGCGLMFAQVILDIWYLWSVKNTQVNAMHLPFYDMQSDRFVQRS
jgi:hypothetical protein